MAVDGDTADGIVPSDLHTAILPLGLKMTPDEMYTLTFDRFMGGWGEVWTFREVAELGLPAIEPHLSRHKRRVMDNLVRSPEWANMVRNRDEFERMGGAEGVATRMTAMSLKSARASIDAASLVFAHSIVDAAAAGFLRVSAMASPADWQTTLDARKFSLADVRASGYDSLFGDLLLQELDRIERNDSLPRKATSFSDSADPSRNGFYQSNMTSRSYGESIDFVMTSSTGID